MSATDADTIVNGNISYALSRTSTDFTINPYTGVISTLRSFDREKKTLYPLTVTATDGWKTHTVQTHVDIYIIDVNDNPPIFDQNIYAATVNATSIKGTPIIQVLATDADIGNNSIVSYSLVPPADIAPYVTITDTGLIEVAKGNIDVPSNYYVIPITAFDKYNVTLKAQAKLQLSVKLLATVAPPPAAQKSSDSGGKSFPQAVHFGSVDIPAIPPVPLACKHQ